MNKKASIFHWTIFGLALAVGILFFFVDRPELGVTVKGGWPLSFVSDVSLEAEKEQLVMNTMVRKLAGETVIELGEESSAAFSERFLVLLKEKLKAKFPETEFSNLKVERNRLTGSCGKIEKEAAPRFSYLRDTTKNYYAKYTYDCFIDVALEYDMLDYQAITIEKNALLSTCKNKKDLDSCITEFKSQRPYWTPDDCPVAQDSSESRKRNFCVGTRDNTKVRDSTGNLVPVRHKFFLDFSPTEPFPMEDFTIEYDANTDLFKAAFVRDPFAAGYNLHYTDWSPAMDVLSRVRDVKNVFNSILTSSMHEIVTFSNPSEENCPQTGVSGEDRNVYLCGNQVVYFFTIAERSDDLFFTITTLMEDKESDIDHFALVG